MGVEVAIIFENNYELRANNLSSSLIVLKVIQRMFEFLLITPTSKLSDSEHNCSISGSYIFIISLNINNLYFWHAF